MCLDELENCAECCAIFLNPELRERFGYQEEEAECRCHDICVEDVRLICVEELTHTVRIPGVDGMSATCRGGRVITQVPFAIDSVTVRCAQEILRPECDGVDNEIGLEIVLSFAVNGVQTFLVINTTVEFTCFQFWTFPGGELREGDDLRQELRFIDGSCKVIVIEDTRILNDTCPRVEIDLKVIDKLWKHENLLVSAIKPYPDENITVSQVFDRNFIGPCVGPPCPPNGV